MQRKLFTRALARGLLLLCQGAGCRRFSLTHRMLRKDGIFFHSKWLCSPECFEAAVEATLMERSRVEGVTVRQFPRLPRMPFRLLLLKDGIVSEEQLKSALQHAELSGATLSQVLLSMALVTEEQLATALAAENGCAFYRLPLEPLPHGWQLPLPLARRFVAAAVRVTPDRVVVGFVDRIDRGLLGIVEKMTGRKAEPCFLTSEQWKAQLAIEPLAARDLPAAAAGPLSAKRASRCVLERALANGAEQVQMARAGELVWVRYNTFPVATRRVAFLHAASPAGMTAVAPFPTPPGEMPHAGEKVSCDDLLLEVPEEIAASAVSAQYGSASEKNLRVL